LVQWPRPAKKKGNIIGRALRQRISELRRPGNESDGPTGNRGARATTKTGKAEEGKWGGGSSWREGRAGVLVWEERRGGGRDALEDGADHLVRHQAAVDEDGVRPGRGGRSRGKRLLRRRRRHGDRGGDWGGVWFGCRWLAPRRAAPRRLASAETGEAEA